MRTTIIERNNKWFPMTGLLIGVAFGILQPVFRWNVLSFIAAGYCVAMAALIFLGLVLFKKIYIQFVYGCLSAFAGILLYYILFGADGGFGAFSTAETGFSTAAHPWLAGEGSLWTRLLGNGLLALPCALALAGLLLAVQKISRKELPRRITSLALSLLFVGTSALFMLTMNLRSRPNTPRLWEGHDDYLKQLGKNKAAPHAPNVIFVIMDDLGYGDISRRGSLIDTPNIDSLAEDGLELANFYSSYSVCSPARFATLTGRYPYRGYHDEVAYPTVAAWPLNRSRINNSFNLGANVDGMLGDEITIAEALQSAGYATAAFGKWHLGDYGEYLPTNQGFDYFFGNHHVNDMNPFYYVRETGGEYKIAHGRSEMKDQSPVSRMLHEEIDQWVRDAVQETRQPFFAYYASPWPHAPLFVSDEFKGKTGLGDYGDCIAEFDYYLGELLHTLEELGVLDDTIILFTSDNGPVREGSTNELTGSKGMVYEGGHKVPFLLRWGNNPGLFEPGETRLQSATSVDLFPTLLEFCGINSIPRDRIYDGLSMLPLIENDAVIHTKEHPILYMKSGKLRALQYNVPTAQLGKDYPVLHDNDTVAFKYFKEEENDNPEFFHKMRTNWLHILTDDSGEHYNRAGVYPQIAEEMSERLDEIANDFQANHRGIIK